MHPPNSEFLAIEKLILNISSSSEEVRDRSVDSLLMKIDLGILSIEQMIINYHFVVAKILEALNDHGTKINQRQFKSRITILSKFLKNNEGMFLLEKYGVFTFLNEMKNFCISSNLNHITFTIEEFLKGNIPKSNNKPYHKIENSKIITEPKQMLGTPFSRIIDNINFDFSISSILRISSKAPELSDGDRNILLSLNSEIKIRKKGIDVTLDSLLMYKILSVIQDFPSEIFTGQFSDLLFEILKLVSEAKDPLLGITILKKIIESITRSIDNGFQLNEQLSTRVYTNLENKNKVFPIYEIEENSKQSFKHEKFSSSSLINIILKAPSMLISDESIISSLLTIYSDFVFQLALSPGSNQDKKNLSKILISVFDYYIGLYPSIPISLQDWLNSLLFSIKQLSAESLIEYSFRNMNLDKFILFYFKTVKNRNQLTYIINIFQGLSSYDSIIKEYLDLYDSMKVLVDIVIKQDDIFKDSNALDLAHKINGSIKGIYLSSLSFKDYIMMYVKIQNEFNFKKDNVKPTVLEYLITFEDMIKYHLESNHPVSKKVAVNLIRSVSEIINTKSIEIIACFIKPVVFKLIIEKVLEWSITNGEEDALIRTVIDILTILLTRTNMEVDSIQIVLFLCQFKDKFGTADSLLSMLSVKSNVVKNKLLFINILSKDPSIASVSLWNLASSNYNMPPILSNCHPFQDIIENSKSNEFSIKSDIELLIITLKPSSHNPTTQNLSDMSEILKQVIEPVLSNEIKSRAVNLLLEFILKNRTFFEIQLITGQLLMICITILRAETDSILSYSLLKTLIAILLYYSFNLELKKTILAELSRELDKGADGLFGTIAKSVFLSKCDQKYKLMFLQLVQITLTLGFISNSNNIKLPESPSHPFFFPMNFILFLNPCQIKLTHPRSSNSNKLVLMDLIKESNYLLSHNYQIKVVNDCPIKLIKEAINEHLNRDKLISFNKIIPIIVDNLDTSVSTEIERLINNALRFIAKLIMSEESSSILSILPLRIFTCFTNKSNEIVKLFTESLTMLIQNLILKTKLNNEDSHVLVAISLKTYFEINKNLSSEFLYHELSSKTEEFSHSHSKYILKELVISKSIMNTISNKEMFALISKLLKGNVYSINSFNDSIKYQSLFEIIDFCISRSECSGVLLANHLEIFQTIKNGMNSRVKAVQSQSVSCLISIMSEVSVPCFLSYILEIGFKTIELLGQFNQVEPTVRDQMIVLLMTILIRLYQSNESQSTLITSTLDLFKRVITQEVSPLMISVLIKSVSVINVSHTNHKIECDQLMNSLLILSFVRLKSFVRIFPNTAPNKNKSSYNLLSHFSYGENMDFSIKQFDDCFNEFTLKDSFDDKESMESNRERLKSKTIPLMITVQYIKSTFYFNRQNSENISVNKSIEKWKSKFSRSLCYSVLNWMSLLQHYLNVIKDNDQLTLDIEQENLIVESLEFLVSNFFTGEHSSLMSKANQTIEIIISIVPKIINNKEKIVLETLGQLFLDKGRYNDCILLCVQKAILFLFWKISNSGVNCDTVDEIMLRGESISSGLFIFIISNIGKTLESFKDSLIYLSQLLRCSNNARRLFLNSGQIKNLYEMILQYRKDRSIPCIIAGILSSVFTISSQVTQGIIPGCKAQPIEISTGDCSILITLLRLVGEYSEETIDRLMINWILHPYLGIYIEEAIRKDKITRFNKLLENVCLTINLREPETLYSLDILAQSAVSEKVSVYFNKKKIPSLLLNIMFELFEKDKKNNFIQSNVKASEKVIELLKIMSFHPIANLNLLEDHSFVSRILVRLWELPNPETQENINILFSNLLAGKTYKSVFVDNDRFLSKLSKDILLSQNIDQYFRLIQLLYNLVFKDASVLLKLPKDELKRCLVGIEVELEGLAKSNSNNSLMVQNTLRNTVNIRRLLQAK